MIKKKKKGDSFIRLPLRALINSSKRHLFINLSTRFILNHLSVVGYIYMPVSYDNFFV